MLALRYLLISCFFVLQFSIIYSIEVYVPKVGDVVAIPNFEVQAELSLEDVGKLVLVKRFLEGDSYFMYGRVVFVSSYWAVICYGKYMYVPLNNRLRDIEKFRKN